MKTTRNNRHTVFTPHRIKNAQQYTEKVFGRLIKQFIDYVEELEKNKQDPSVELIDAKIDELNQKWIDHCNRYPAIKPEGKLVFKQEIGRIIDETEARIIALAKDPEGTTSILKN